MNDFEERIKAALNADVDHKLGERRAAPPLRVGPSSRRHRSPWVLPLLAAACVATLVAGSLGVTRLLADHDHRPATPPTISHTVVSTPTPTRSSSAAPSPSATPSRSSGSAPARSSRGAADTGRFVTLGRARLYLPKGWVARDLWRYSPTWGRPYVGWCLTPATQPVSRAVGGCPVEFAPFDPARTRIDVDTTDGLASNPEYCFHYGPSADEKATRTEEEYGDRSFGGRAAEWRHWEIHCGDGRHYSLEQYVVPTLPVYIMWSPQATRSVHAAMTTMAERSTLPPMTAPLRVMDRGYVRSVDSTGSGVRITLDRAVRQGGSLVNKNPATYEYPIPNGVWESGPRPIRVGSLVHIESDGTRVTGITVEDPAS